MRPARAPPRRPPSADFRKFIGARKRLGTMDSRFRGRASCQNQDLRDYRIFRIPLSHLCAASAHPQIPNRIGGIFGRGEKRKPGENEILKIPRIP